ncbi:MAG: Dabb family protein [Clostridia bacterium]|nr:Dabb family protein [Clostridia bacterium]
MVKHIVCFKLKEGESKEKAKEVLLSMKEHTPWLRGIKVHIDELQTARSFDVILETLFETFMDLEEYQVDRYHVDVVKKHMHAVTEKSISLDFQVEKEEF